MIDWSWRKCLLHWFLLFVYSIVLFLCLDVHRVTSISVTFSYRTCVANLPLLLIEHQHNGNNEQIHLNLKDFQLELQQIYQTKRTLFSLGSSSPLDPSPWTFYSYQIEKWNYVNVTFDDHQSRLYLSLNDDQTRVIPLMHYPWISSNGSTSPSTTNVKIIADRNVSCLLPHHGFPSSTLRSSSSCSINLKNCGRCSSWSNWQRSTIGYASFRTSIVYKLIPVGRTVLSSFLFLWLSSVHGSVQSQSAFDSIRIPSFRYPMRFTNDDDDQSAIVYEQYLSQWWNLCGRSNAKESFTMYLSIGYDWMANIDLIMQGSIV